MAVDREASAIRTVVLLAASFPGEPETQIRNLLRRHIDEAVSAEWPAMAKRAVSLKVAPPALAEALRLALTLSPESEGQILARNEIVRELENAMHARGTHQPQPVDRELGQVDLHVRAGRLCAGRDRFRLEKDRQLHSRVLNFSFFLLTLLNFFLLLTFLTRLAGEQSPSIRVNSKTDR